MRHRPYLAYIGAFAFFGLAIALPLQITFLYGHSLAEFEHVIGKLSVTNWLIMGLFCVLGYLTLNISRSIIILLPISVLLVGWNNYLVGTWGYDYTAETTWIATLTYFLFSFYPLHPVFSEFLKDPKKRWWLVAPRKDVRVPVKILPIRGGKIYSQTVDLSKTGAFIKSPFRADDTIMNLGDIIQLHLQLGTISDLRLEAEVVRSQTSDDDSPAGYGIQFRNLDYENRRTLNHYLSQLDH